MYNFTPWTAFSQCINIYIYFTETKISFTNDTEYHIVGTHCKVQIQDETCLETRRNASVQKASLLPTSQT